MTDVQRRVAAKDFVEYWKNRGRERAEYQSFWTMLLRNVFGITDSEKYIDFNEPVEVDNKKEIDAIIYETRVLIEHKSRKIVDLNTKLKQSGDLYLTPFEQAKRYADWLPTSKRPFWIITCNFNEFWIYNMENPQAEPEKILLVDLGKEYHRLNFLVNPDSDNAKEDTAISLQAGEFVKEFYNAVIKQYQDPESPEARRSLNMLCVRIVFCLYAGSAEVFGKKYQFRDYIKKLADRDINTLHEALETLFQVLNKEEKDRNKYLNDDLAAFPYVNGGLFEDENIEIPRFNEEIVSIILKNRDENFDWSEINPTIFGAVFESTLNPDTRRSGGMHYTSIENIHKVIDPLFLDGLKQELVEIKAKKQVNIRLESLRAFQEKLSNLTFLDPACGSGNFLTETYISLRRLENSVIEALQDYTISKKEFESVFRNKDFMSESMQNVGQIKLDSDKIIRVSIGQFYGFEVNDFAVKVAKTALWIAESQMMKETEDIVRMNLDFLPLKSYANIIECNALRIDWEDVVPKSKLNYIMGNPPFLGKQEQSEKQKQEMKHIFGSIKGAGNLDYVSAWYFKSSEYTKGTTIKVAFVSTNSITQGEQVPILWKPLMGRGVFINFYVPTFKWGSEAKGNAAVHCVIVGFSFIKTEPNINPYLLKAPTVFIESRSKPICDVPKMDFGNMPNDAKGLLSNYSTEQKNNIISKYPETEKWFKRIYGAEEFINDIERWCLWLKGSSPSERAKSKFLNNILPKIEVARGNSTREATRKLSETPYLFGEIRQPETDYILIPCHSSENRKYIPIGFMGADFIATNATLVIPNASLYHFGILTSNVHMEWVRTFCGRIKSDYRYSKDVIYNNFPWINTTEKQKDEIEKLAQDVLDVRELENFADCSLYDLYKHGNMPPELLKAHKALDKAVMRLYGFKAGVSEAEIVAGLMGRYKELVGGVKK